MHQTRKGQQWYFGMKLHIGVDSQSGLAHSAVVTAANVHDKHPLPDLLHGDERRVYGDSAYASQKALIQAKAPNAQGLHQPARAQGGGEVDEVERAKNRNKSKIRARVEHVFARGQAAVGLRQGALPRPGQERHARVRGAGAGQHLPRAATTVGTSPCIASQERANARSQRKNGTYQLENAPQVRANSGEIDEIQVAAKRIVTVRQKQRLDQRSFSVTLAAAKRLKFCFSACAGR